MNAARWSAPSGESGGFYVLRNQSMEVQAAGSSWSHGSKENTILNITTFFMFTSNRYEKRFPLNKKIIRKTFL